MQLPSFYFWSPHIFPLVLFWFFISWHHDNPGNERRTLQIYWQQGWIGNALMAGEKNGIAVMFLRLAETKIYSKHILLESFLSWLFSLGRRIKLFVTITFVGLPWDHGVEFAQTLCDSYFTKPLDNKSSLRPTFPWRTPSFVVAAISKPICMSEKKWLSVTCISMYICCWGFLLGTTLKWTKERNPKILRLIHCN